MAAHCDPRRLRAARPVSVRTPDQAECEGGRGVARGLLLRASRSCSILSRRSCGFDAVDSASRRDDRPVCVEVQQALVERLHPVVLAVGDDLLELVGLRRVGDLVEDATGRDEHLHRRAPGRRGRALTSRCETIPLSDAGERHAHLLLLVRREEVDDAVDRLGRAHRVQRREHEVTGLGGRQRGPHRLGVAHLTDEDDVGVLAQHALERAEEVVGVRADLALVDDRLLVGVEDLDRVLDRHDVARLRSR